MKFSVIMPVNLSPYEWGNFKSAKYPDMKFIRAITSFADQSHADAELIIVSDGCSIAEDIYKIYFSHLDKIKFTRIDKQEKFSGVVRQTGLDMADGDLICYLDHDDYIGKVHLSSIDYFFSRLSVDWVYYNDSLIRSFNPPNVEEREVKPEQNFIGTSCICHKRSIGVKWGDGYGHDMDMIKNYLLPLPHAKIPTPAYYVCHSSGLNIDL
jgi:glycosyltransferase involved in cell wall biosynthesis